MIPCLPGLLGSAGAFADTRWTLNNVQYVGDKDFILQVEDFVFSTDGNHFYFTNSDTNTIFQWDLLTPGLISTAVDSGKSLVMTSDGITNPKGLSFKPDMSRLYVHQYSAGANSGTLFEYNVSDFTDISLSTIVAGTAGQPFDTSTSKFNYNGTKLRSFDLFNPFEVYSQDVPTPYSLSTVTSIIDTVPGLFSGAVFTHSWKDDTTRLMTSGATGNTFIELWSMSSDDINTLQLIDTYNVTASDLSYLTKGAFVSNDGSNVYTRSPDLTQGLIRQYSL